MTNFDYALIQRQLGTIAGAASNIDENVAEIIKSCVAVIDGILIKEKLEN